MSSLAWVAPVIKISGLFCSPPSSIWISSSVAAAASSPYSVKDVDFGFDSLTAVGVYVFSSDIEDIPFPVISITLISLPS